MPEHSNIEAVRRGYEAFNKGDMDTVAALFSDDVVWHVPGRSALAGDYRGRNAVFSFLGELSERTEGTYHSELHIAVGDDEHVISVDQTTARQGERVYEGQELVVFRFRDGRVEEVWQALLSPYHHDEFFS
jgi:ketosteroid isomerase-like protein